MAAPFWLKSELFLTKIRTTNSEIHSFGRAKKKGLGEGIILRTSDENIYSRIPISQIRRVGTVKEMTFPDR